jgi:restriction system protein
LKETEYFIRTHVSEKLTRREDREVTKRKTHLIALIENRVATATANNPELLNVSLDRMTPSEFEKHCAERLQNFGWTARVTGASGDQGVDVIAEKASTRVVLQCKLYSKSVANKAVQEAAAGRSHYGARFAVVVSNNSYTPSADQLAKTNDVLLLHYTQLDDLDRLLGVEESNTINSFPIR